MVMVTYLLIQKRWDILTYVDKHKNNAAILQCLIFQILNVWSFKFLKYYLIKTRASCFLTWCKIIPTPCDWKHNAHSGSINFG